MKTPNLAIETIGTPFTLSDEAAHCFARGTYDFIRKFCLENKEEFEAWLQGQEQEGGDGVG